MTGVLWAAVSGIGFGIFQAFNRRAGRGFDAYRATFILIFVSAAVLALGSVLSGDLSPLLELPLIAYVDFALAGLLHFFLGWTFLSISQVRVGAARTGALVGATPLFATFIAALAFEEFLRLPVLLGVLTVVAGVYLVSVSGGMATGSSEARWPDFLFGLGTALCFAISPIFIRGGLEYLASPILGVTIGMGVSAFAYGLVLLFRRDNGQQGRIPKEAWFFQLAAAIFVGLSTWMRWIALDMTAVGVVLALGRLNVPVVILLSPIVVGRLQERVNARVWSGAALIVAGSLVLIFFR